MLRMFETIPAYVIDACTRKKPLKAATDFDTKLNRCLGTIDVTFIGVSITLGAGIYIATGEVAREKAGPAIIISFLIAAIASGLSGLCYAEAGARFPKAGSAYVYCYVTMGEICAFFIGWTMLFEYIIGVASVSKGIVNYIDPLTNGKIANETINLLGEIHVPGFNNYFDLFATGVVILFTIIICLGIKIASWLNVFLVSANITTLVIVITAAFIKAEPKNWTNFAPFGIRGILQGASTCFYAFIGFDMIAMTSEETKNPGKSIPRGIIATVIITLFLYLGVSASLTLMVPYYELDPSAAITTAFKQRNLYALVYVISMGAIVSLLCCTMSSSIGPSRLMYSMACDGLIPSVFAKVYSRTKVPIVAIVTGGLLAALLASLLEFKVLVDMFSIGTLLAYSTVDISVLVLRYQKPKGYADNKKLKEIHDSTKPVDASDYIKLKIYELQHSPTFINAVIFALIFEIFCACILVVLFSDQLCVEREPFCIIVFTLLVILTLLSAIFLFSLQDNTTEELPFRVPLVPWIPIIALIFNFTLMLGLSSFTWIRLVIWTIIGVFVYFGYGMHHSLQRNNSVDVLYSLIDEPNDNYDDGELTSEESELLGIPNKDYLFIGYGS